MIWKAGIQEGKAGKMKKEADPEAKLQKHGSRKLRIHSCFMDSRFHPLPIFLLSSFILGPLTDLPLDGD